MIAHCSHLRTLPLSSLMYSGESQLRKSRAKLPLILLNVVARPPLPTQRWETHILLYHQDMMQQQISAGKVASRHPFPLFPLLLWPMLTFYNGRLWLSWTLVCEFLFCIRWKIEIRHISIDFFLSHSNPYRYSNLILITLAFFYSTLFNISLELFARLKLVENM